MPAGIEGMDVVQGATASVLENTDVKLNVPEGSSEARVEDPEDAAFFARATELKGEYYALLASEIEALRTVLQLQDELANEMGIQRPPHNRYSSDFPCGVGALLSEKFRRLTEEIKIGRIIQHPVGAKERNEETVLAKIKEVAQKLWAIRAEKKRAIETFRVFLRNPKLDAYARQIEIFKSSRTDRYVHTAASNKIQDIFNTVAGLVAAYKQRHPESTIALPDREKDNGNLRLWWARNYLAYEKEFVTGELAAFLDSCVTQAKLAEERMGDFGQFLI